MKTLNEIQTGCQTAISVGGFTASWLHQKEQNMLFYVNHCENK